jgi:hypothetical protein
MRKLRPDRKGAPGQDSFTTASRFLAAGWRILIA